MAVDRPTFHESWHRVEGLRPWLRASTRTTRQVYRGNVWHVFEDPTGSQFFRVNEPAYRLIGLLDGRRTVAEAWSICNERLGDDAPTQGEVIQLLGQMFSSNLIAGEGAADADALFRRQKKRIGREVRSYLMSLLFLRIPLWNPDAFLTRWLPLVAWLFAPIGLVLWLALIAVGGYHLLGRGEQMADQLSGVLAPDNLLWLYVVFAGIKLLHELGHGFACKAFGRLEDDGSGSAGAVHTLGVMFLIFMPVAYVDATSSWGFRRKLHRIVVGAAGMIVELAIAAVAAVVWARSAEGTAAHALAYNAIFIAGVSTLVFNGNPLMRYDGYYILSDLLEIPNLAKRSQDFVQYLWRKFAFGVRRAVSPAQTPGEHFWLPTYWAASLAYRVLVYVAIILLIADQRYALGAVLLIFIAGAWVLFPLGKFVRYVASDPELMRTRKRAGWVTLATLALATGVLGFIPAPQHVRIEGVIEPARFSNAFAETDAWLERCSESGSTVEPGTGSLVESDSVQLRTTLRSIEAQERALVTERRAALSSDPAEVKRLDESLLAVADQKRWINESIASLVIVPSMGGTWIAPGLADRAGSYIRRGESLGVVADLGALIVRGTAEQNTAARLIAESSERVEIRARARPQSLITGTVERIFPAGSESLPSPALGFVAGGSIAVDPSEPSGQRTAAPIFEVRIALDEPAGLMPGQRVVARFRLPNKPLAVQGWSAVRRVLQERFRI